MLSPQKGQLHLHDTPLVEECPQPISRPRAGHMIKFIAAAVFNYFSRTRFFEEQQRGHFPRRTLRRLGKLPLQFGHFCLHRGHIELVGCGVRTQLPLHSVIVEFKSLEARI